MVVYVKLKLMNAQVIRVRMVAHVLINRMDFYALVQAIGKEQLALNLKKVVVVKLPLKLVPFVIQVTLMLVILRDAIVLGLLQLIMEKY